jgi:hypothetical protein
VAHAPHQPVSWLLSRDSTQRVIQQLEDEDSSARGAAGATTRHRHSGRFFQIIDAMLKMVLFLGARGCQLSDGHLKWMQTLYRQVRMRPRVACHCDQWECAVGQENQARKQVTDKAKSERALPQSDQSLTIAVTAPVRGAYMACARHYRALPVVLPCAGAASAGPRCPELPRPADGRVGHSGNQSPTSLRV